jgi:hypothetical protein
VTPFKAVAGPALFTKGMLRYQQGCFEEARRLMLKAGRS